MSDDVLEDILNKIDTLINIDADLKRVLDLNRKHLDELRKYIDSIKKLR